MFGDGLRQTGEHVLKLTKSMLITAIIGAVGLASPPSSAATVITPVSVPGGTLDLSNPLGTINAILLTAGQTYDFTFASSGGSFSALVQVQASLLSPSAATPELVSFGLYNGMPGSGTLVALATPSIGPALSTTLQAGNHYIEIGTIAANMELLSGSLQITASQQESNQSLGAVPEPSTWVIMMAGFGILGGLLRFNHPLVDETERNASVLSS